ncbi:MAG: FAD-binding oxidoreductase, partial [Gemmatimonadaceae bacterium]
MSSIHTLPGAGRSSSAATAPRSLAAALRRELRGDVRFDTGSRALYATDSSNYRQVPIGVVIPRDVDDLVAAVATCHRFDVPVLARGGGTSLAGQCCNAAVVIDCSKYVNRLVELNVPQHFARVQPGLVLDTLRDAARPHDLTFGPDPATHNHCTLGGMLGNNSCGVHSVMAGRTSDNVEELEVLTYDGLRMRVGRTSDAELERLIASGGRRGEIYAGLRALRDAHATEIRRRYPRIPRRVSGFNLDDLLPERGFNVARALVGSEGTCVTILEATVNLVPWPRAQTLVALGYPDAYTTADHVPEIMATRPIGLEGFGAELLTDMKKTGFHPEDISLLPEGGGWLLVQYGADTKEEADAKARGLMTQLRGKAGAPAMRHCADPHEAARIWTVRDAALGVTAIVPGKRRRWAGWEDAAVPPERLGDYLRAMHALLERYDYHAALYGHFGQGCIH